ncbi:MAG: UDP-N-acetylglucosamine 1-carboxyvinyltransferase [Clostridiaceae bacterium]|nr:UDP-N-acetylglucosamine 1-carboxyvinyltransferase [Clostridiaceae bacterium]
MSNRISIRGGHPLFGEVNISGAKNAAVAIIPATILANDVCRLENIPDIVDVMVQLEIIKGLGANVKFINPTTVEIDSRHIGSDNPPYDLMRRLRASYYLMGALLGRFNRAEVAMPGGCNFGGVRPIDLHIKGFEMLGAKTCIKEGGFVCVEAENGLVGRNIFLDVVSVGATINIMLAAVRAKGQTVIENAAKEPHIVDLANFLNSMGAKVMGAGTDIIKIHGVEVLHGGSYSIIPDQIEAGTYMAAVTAAGGSLLIKNIIPKHLECISAKLLEMGCEVDYFDDSVRISRNGPIHRTNIKTLPYPGFPTDMQPQLAVPLCLADGASVITEGVWDSRYRYVDELRKMGANIHVDGKVAVVDGVGRLTGAPVRASDLRAGAAMIIAGLVATGETTVEGIVHIERGYDNIVGKLKSAGADIEYLEDDPADTETRDIG